MASLRISPQAEYLFSMVAHRNTELQRFAKHFYSFLDLFIQFYCFLKYTNERKGILNCIKFIANMYYHRRKRHADMPPTDFHYDTKTKRMGVGPYVNCKGCFCPNCETVWDDLDKHANKHNNVDQTTEK